ncbi:unnamed protein product [Pseudo-nitzschia multistriata]|uniref:Uncharacterized protein n=1 Tax=Pseudo-nitzschia multistriata TaxID=183589 RepID=A0A448YU80_9STRA|nr:unnamed protein product [Pseudo-nitzschia multistriata]
MGSSQSADPEEEETARVRSFRGAGGETDDGNINGNDDDGYDYSDYDYDCDDDDDDDYDCDDENDREWPVATGDSHRSFGPAPESETALASVIANTARTYYGSDPAETNGGHTTTDDDDENAADSAAGTLDRSNAAINENSISETNDDSDTELERFFRELGLFGGGALASDQSSLNTNAATATAAAATAGTGEDAGGDDWSVPDHRRGLEWTRRSLETLVSGSASAAPVLGLPGSPPSAQGGPLRGPSVSLALLARETHGRRPAPHAPASDRLRSLGGSALYGRLDGPSAGMCSEVAVLEEAIDERDWAATQAVVSRISPRLIGDPSSAHPGAGVSGPEADPSLPPTAPRFYAGGGRIGLERDAFVLSGGIGVLVRVFREPAFVGEPMARSFDARDLIGGRTSRGRGKAARGPPSAMDAAATNTYHRLGNCWNEALACLRELVYSVPSLLETERVFCDEGEGFLPFLFSLLSHDPFFDGAATLIEEVLCLQSSPQPAPQQHQQEQQQQQQEQTTPQPSSASSPLHGDREGSPDRDRGGDGDAWDPPPTPAAHDDTDDHHGGGDADDDDTGLPRPRVPPPTTFFLGNVPDLYALWGGFNCRQLAQFCRILALLIFEPEDRQLLESPVVLKSLELLALRKARAARSGRDSTVDLNQSILLGDERLLGRLLGVLRVLNYGPALRCYSPFHVMARFPYVADTLTMLGLHELERWTDVFRYDRLARTLPSYAGNQARGGGGNEHDPPPGRQLHELGSVAGMLGTLSESFRNTEGESINQLGHIISVISAAQEAGIVVGRSRQAAPGPRGSGLASAAGILIDAPFSRQGQSHGHYEAPESGAGSGDPMPYAAGRSRLVTPKDAANILQFNALLLGPFQVEILFVLCTLLGGRRKVDAQELLKGSGITSILDDMFQRMPWDSLSPTREPVAHRGPEGSGDSPPEAATGSDNDDDHVYGIHGPGCECTPESALCVQYLRLLHNFCDRDCDNYRGRRLLLSPCERGFVFGGVGVGDDLSGLAPGLLSKIVAAFVGESEESPYRFWLASCVESYLRGSSSVEQVFVARTGLMKHLIEDVSSQRLHCAGSLQTSFDLLGELCKGNLEVLGLLGTHVDTEEKFRRLMSVAASNLVDSNVFIRSLILSLERLSSGSRFHDLRASGGVPDAVEAWERCNGGSSWGFLTHSWLDADAVSAGRGPCLDRDGDGATEGERKSDRTRPLDWFPESPWIAEPPAGAPSAAAGDRSGRFGWAFAPGEDAGSDPSISRTRPGSIDRLSWFLSTNRTRLLRDLLEVVSLKNINHENICCLNTAVVITMFAHRRGELEKLLSDLKDLNDDDKEFDDRSALLRRGPGEARDIRKNFREVLWFWMEYYTHRGRDRLSLEFSSRMRFHQWMEVVALLAADDGSPTSLVRRPLRLPESPYGRLAS